MKATAKKLGHGKYLISVFKDGEVLYEFTTLDSQLYDAVQAYFKQGLNHCEGCWFESRQELEDYLISLFEKGKEEIRQK